MWNPELDLGNNNSKETRVGHFKTLQSKVEMESLAYLSSWYFANVNFLF